MFWYVSAWCDIGVVGLISSRSLVAVIGYAILLGINVKKNPGVAYFAVFLTVAATGPLIATTISWTANTWGNHCKSGCTVGYAVSDVYGRQEGDCNGNGVLSREQRWNRLIPSLSK
jgi:hypothetical protein